VRDVQRSARRANLPCVARLRLRALSLVALRVIGQPCDVLLVEQTAYFWLMRKHGSLLSLCVGVVGVDVGVVLRRVHEDVRAPSAWERGWSPREEASIVLA